MAIDKDDDYSSESNETGRKFFVDYSKRGTAKYKVYKRKDTNR